ncbi:thymidine kinase 2, mitochondrial-like [Mytilus edulis]|uniref:thymidine kinase 2, mitochondrial-like n=1 Tax=Mytilus edulis TaxID=6550 RepID=UPI0039F076F5
MIGLQHLNLENVKKPSSKDKGFTVAVEGNIGSGKSTFLQYFKNFPEVDLIPEPVSKWKDVNGFNTLEMMYKDASRWSLAFQSYVQLTMAEGHRKDLKDKHKSLKMMERSIFSARYCFVENLRRQDLMAEVDYCILSEFYKWILNHEDTNIDLIVYLRADPHTCQERIRKRNRHEEKDVPIEYLQSLHDLHEDWLMHQKQFELPAPVIVIEANEDITKLYPKFNQCKEEIFSKIQSLPSMEELEKDIFKEVNLS